MNDDPMTLVDLRGLAHGDLALAGGKAQNLGELLRAGFPVPPGFCVTTRAWTEAIGDRLGAILVALEATAADDLGALEVQAAAARGLIEATALPEALAVRARAAYHALGDDVAVAVRSSATAEDLPDASFAGQQDTYLNVIGVDAVLAAIVGCWASLFSDRAVAYRAAKGIGHRGLELAVVVQALIPAAVAGVVFTADPIGGLRSRIVIEASPGLGEAVVSGAATPDRFAVDEGPPRAIVERQIGAKEVRIDRAPGGGTVRHEQAAGEGRGACLDDDQVLELSALARAVEAHYAAPQDLEFAFAEDGALWLLQARPITTLYPLPLRAADDHAPLRVYFNFNVAQGVLQPLTPMGLQAWRLLLGGVYRHVGRPLADPIAGPPIIHASAERLLIELTPMLRSSVGRRLVPAVLKRMETRSQEIVLDLLADPRLAPIPTSRLRILRAALGVARRTRVPPRFLRALIAPSAALRRLQATLRANASRRDAPVVGDAHHKIDGVRDMLGAIAPTVLFAVMPVAFVGFFSRQVLIRLVGGKVDPHRFDELLRALPNNPTTAMDLDLYALAARIAADPASVAILGEESVDAIAERFRVGDLPGPFTAGLRAFLADHGERGVAEIDIGVPRWRDDPRHLIGILRGYLELVGTDLAPDKIFARGEAIAAEATEAMVAAAGFGRRWLVRGLCRRVRELTGIRERPKLEMVRTLDRARSILREVADELVAAGRLEVATDVYFVDLRELHAAVDGEDLRALVRDRKAIRARELGRRTIPRILLSDGTAPTAAGLPTSADALHGMAASSGVVQATARVIRDPVGARLPAGAILVAPATDPGWTPLFLSAGGLVMEMGGAMSHGAVVAREYGIPAVVGVPGATDRIVDGQTIRVDGGRGVVDLKPAG